MKKLVNLNLPPCAWLQDETLIGRNVILHVRSASVVEVFTDDAAMIGPDAIRKKFRYRDVDMLAVLHHAPLLSDLSAEEITEQVLDPAIDYFIEDLDRIIDSEDLKDASAMN